MIPMGPEEAALQLELVGHDFFVFRNDRTREINVVYRRQGRHVRPDRAGASCRSSGAANRSTSASPARAASTWARSRSRARRAGWRPGSTASRARGSGTRSSPSRSRASPASARASSRWPTRRSSSRKEPTSSRSRSPSSRQRRSPTGPRRPAAASRSGRSGSGELDVVELPDDPGGDELTLSVHDGERTASRSTAHRRSARSRARALRRRPRALLRRPGTPDRRHGLGGRGDAALGVDRGRHVHPGDGRNLLPRSIGRARWARAHRTFRTGERRPCRRRRAGRGSAFRACRARLLPRSRASAQPPGGRTLLTDAPLWISTFPCGSCTTRPAPASANSCTAPAGKVYVGRDRSPRREDVALAALHERGHLALVRGRVRHRPGRLPGVGLRAVRFSAP